MSKLHILSKHEADDPNSLAFSSEAPRQMKGEFTICSQNLLWRMFAKLLNNITESARFFDREKLFIKI